MLDPNVSTVILGLTRSSYQSLEDLAKQDKRSFTFMIVDDLPDQEFFEYFSKLNGSYGFYRLTGGKLYHVQTLLNQDKLVYNWWTVDPVSGQLIRDYQLNGAKVRNYRTAQNLVLLALKGRVELAG